MEGNSTNGKLSFASVISFLKTHRKTASLLSSGFLFALLIILSSPLPDSKPGKLDKSQIDEIRQQINDRFVVETREIEIFQNKLIENIQKWGVGAITRETGDNYFSSAVYDSSMNFIAGYSLLSEISSDEFNSTRQQKLFIKRNAIFSWLCSIKQVKIKNNQCFLISAAVLEKNYTLKNQYNLNEALFDELKKEFNVDITFSGEKDDPSNTLVFSDKNKQLFSVRLSFPQNPVETTSIATTLTRLLLFLTSITLLMSAVYFRLISFYITLKASSIKSFYLPPIVVDLFLLIVIVLVRIFLLEFDAGKLLGLGVFDNPANYSSPFGFGVAKSPVNLLITAFLGAMFAVFVIFNHYKNFANTHTSTLRLIFSIITGTAGLILTVRALAAIQRSIVYDSSLRYFLGDSIIPGKDVTLMNVSIVLASFTLIALATLILYRLIESWINLFEKFTGEDSRKFKFRVINLAGWIVPGATFIVYFATRDSELIPALPSLLLMIALLISVITFRKNRSSIVLNFLIISLAASVASIILLSKFNEDLEKDSLKKIALEINRPTTTFMRFLVQQSLSVALKQQFNTSSGEKELQGMAFRIWSGSILNGEVFPCKITIYRGKDKIDIFSPFGIPALNDFEDTPDPTITDISIREKEIADGSIISGVIPVSMDDSTGFFTVVSILRRDFQVPGAGIPEFLRPDANPVNDIIDLRRMSIFKFSDNSPQGNFGELQLPERVLNSINQKVSTGLSEEMFRTVVDGSEASVFFSFSLLDESEQLTILILKDKDPVRILFNFFKLFFLHSIFIFSLLVIFILLKIKIITSNFYRFRFQLTASFLVISTIPILALGIFNRDNQAAADEKNRYLTLKSRSEKVKQMIQGRDSSSSSPLPMGIPFILFKNGLEYKISSNELRAPLIPTLSLLPASVSGVVSLKDVFLAQSIDKYRYYSLSRSWVTGNDVYSVLVNDISDRDEQSLSMLEFDVFLFGVYSLAIILTTLFATALSGRISSPIIKLTRAANSVALGNFEYEISSTSRGEIGELIRGFKYMTDELRKNQDEIALLEREAAWKEMAKQVAHEVKNPLTPMKLSVQHLLSAQKDNARDLPALTEKILNSLLKQIEILNQTASEFSKFAKMPGFEPHKIEIVSLISEVKDLYTGSPTRLNFSTSLSDAIIKGDESFFKRSVINLIRNAVQAGASSVSLSLNLVDNNYELIVADNGKGISAENRDKIFEINFTTKATGTGLGLKLTRRFVESAGGSIELLDKKPGAHFKITFPVLHDSVNL